MWDVYNIWLSGRLSNDWNVSIYVFTVDDVCTHNNFNTSKILGNPLVWDTLNNSLDMTEILLASNWCSEKRIENAIDILRSYTAS